MLPECQGGQGGSAQILQAADEYPDDPTVVSLLEPFDLVGKEHSLRPDSQVNAAGLTCGQMLKRRDGKRNSQSLDGLVTGNIDAQSRVLSDNLARNDAHARASHECGDEPV